MKRCETLITGPEFSRLIYGTWRLLDTQPTALEINRRLHACLELGITTIDTAEIYGTYGVEALLGEALRSRPACATSWKSSPRQAFAFPTRNRLNGTLRTTMPPAQISSIA